MRFKQQVHRARAALLAFVISLTGAPALAASGAAPTPTTSTPNGLAVNVWGDSLTAGSEDQSGLTLSTTLSADLGIPVTNNGIGSQKSTQIAMRQGGVGVQLSFTSNLIQYYVQAVSALQGASVAGMSTNQDPDYRFLSSTGYNGGWNTSGAVCGVHGYLSASGSGGPPSTSQNYFFTPDGVYPTTNVLASTPVACPANSVFTPDAASMERLQPAIFWYGTNNYTQPTQIQSDLAASIAYLGHSNYLCLTIPNAETEVSGSTPYIGKVTANADITSTCGSAHTFDIREYLVGQYNAANPVDVYDHANDIVPYSLRAIIMRGTTSAISNTTTCSFTLTPIVVGAVGGGTLKVDSEYIYISSVSGNTVTGCTRGFGTGGVAATHSSGAAVTLTDNLHIGGNGDALAAGYIAANYKAALLGSTQSTVPTNKAVGGLLNFPNQWTAPQFFQYPIYEGLGEIWEGPNCIQQAYGGLAQQIISPLSNILCSVPGSGTITLGGSFNTLICFNLGGAPESCPVTLPQTGMITLKNGVADQGYVYNTTATSGSTVVIPAGKDALDLNVGALSALTIELYACNSTYDGMVFHMDTSGTITTLTLTASDGSVGTNANPGTLTRSAAVKCNGTQATWFAY